MSPVVSLTTFAGVHLVATMSPGPAVLSTVQISVRSSRRTTLLHALGLGLAIATWALVTLAGLDSLLVRASWLLRAFQILGGIYLMYIGVHSWRQAKVPFTSLSGQQNWEVVQPERSIFRALRGGFLTNIGNPKVMVFFGSIFTAILTPSMPHWVRFSALAVVLINEVGWNALVGMLLSTPHAQNVYARLKAAIDRFAGAFMFLFGLRLVYEARSRVSS